MTTSWNAEAFTGQASPTTVDVDALDRLGSDMEGDSQSPGIMAPPPNPPFVFPARQSASSAPPSFSRATGRRPRSAVESGNRSFGLGEESDSSSTRSSALPAFSFNPGATAGSDSSMLSPPISPHSPRGIPTRPGVGHRRGGSEFVGGKMRSGDAISTSPTKSESGFASPTFPPPRPAGRRGHAHRRSTALSSHDLSTIMNPTSSISVPHGSSLPSSPGEETPDRQLLSVTIAEKRPVPEIAVPKDVDQQTSLEKTPVPRHSPMSRARVGFSDNVEYIPRPLSLISTDTSSTITAIRGHSASGSLSSIVSGPVSVPVEPVTAPPLLPTDSHKISESRPSTAGAILDRTPTDDVPDEAAASPRRRNSIPLLLSAASSPSSASPADPSPTKTPKRWSFFGIEPFVGSRPVSACSYQSSSYQDSSEHSSTENVAPLQENTDTPSAKGNSKRAGKKQKKKVKTWAESILTRRSKTKQQRAKAVALENNDTMKEPQSPEENSASIETSTSPPMPVLMVTGSPDPLQPEGSNTRPVADDDGSYPVIDLDAALGPFNTPLPFNPEWEAAQRAGAPAKRKLHSAAGMSHFNGPGGHYHRRAESAPEMAPFEQARFGIPRFGSSSTMADVFEEEEEEDEEAGKTRHAKKSASEQQLVMTSETSRKDSVASAPSLTWATPETSGSTTNLSKIPSISGRPEALIPHSTAPDATIFEVSTSAVNRDQAETAEGSPRRIVPLRDLAPVDISLQLPSASLAPGSPFSMTQSSCFPSPRSPMSYEANRVSTAAYSIAEENTFQSLLMGEPGPEVRYSVDADIPSLTSSNSTMTKDSTCAPPHSSHGHTTGQRPASLSSVRLSQHRSSIASLSRLISGSNGQRSKLSVEVVCDTEPEKKAKISKTKRLSRKLQFWKPGKEDGQDANHEPSSTANLAGPRHLTT